MPGILASEAVATQSLEPLLTELETAAALRVTDRTVRNWEARGILRAIRIGGVKRYRASDIADLIGPSTSESPGAGERTEAFAKSDVASSRDACSG